jgi:lipopolysaccharide export LptBFGC system permease protein LptF
MRSSPRIARYLALEVLQYTVLAFLAASPVILIPNVFAQLGDFLVTGVTGSDIRVVMGWVLVLVAAYSLPIAFVFGLLLALGRLHADHEIAAMRVCGLSVFALVTPVVGIGALLSLFTGTVLIGFEHEAWRQIEATKRQILSRGAVIEPGRFQRFGRRMILAQNRRDKDRFEGIMISDYTAEGKPLLIFAESADYSFEPDTGMLRLLLSNGDIRLDPYPNEEFREHRISFTKFDYSFRAPGLVSDRWQFRPTQLSLAELRSAIARKRGKKNVPALENAPRLKWRVCYYEAMLHRLFAIPAAPLLFSLIGVPLAILGFVRSRPRGMLLALLLLGAYYASFVFVYGAGRSCRLPPLPAVWAPNAVLFAIGVVLLFRAARSRQ